MSERLDYGDRVKITCAECGHKFYLHKKSVRKMVAKLGGKIPCERCGSTDTEFEEKR